MDSKCCLNQDYKTRHKYVSFPVFHYCFKFFFIHTQNFYVVNDVIWPGLTLKQIKCFMRTTFHKVHYSKLKTTNIEQKIFAKIRILILTLSHKILFKIFSITDFFQKETDQRKYHILFVFLFYRNWMNWCSSVQYYNRGQYRKTLSSLLRTMKIKYEWILQNCKTKNNSLMLFKEIELCLWLPYRIK